MKERTLLRFDTFVALCALLASSIAAAAMVYQTRVLQDQFSATVWPYLTISNDNNDNHEALFIDNQGVGPALLRSEQLQVDGRNVPDWNTAVALLFAGVAHPHGTRWSFQFETMNASSAIRAGESLRIAYIASNNRAVIRKVVTHRISLDLCYCSINARCWRVDAGGDYSGGRIPEPVRACTSDASIGGHPFKT